MNRSALDKLISSAGILMTVVLFSAAGGLFYAHSFVHTQVKNQLAAQNITFPASGSPALEKLTQVDREAVEPYAGQQLVNGKQAQVFADHYIAAHISTIGGSKTYSELSSASMANPADTKLASQVQTVFRGETLRGMLLNAYAFDTMAMVAKYSAIASLVAAAVLLILSALGFYHAGRVSIKTKKGRK